MVKEASQEQELKITTCVLKFFFNCSFYKFLLFAGIFRTKQVGKEFFPAARSVFF